MQSFAQVPDTPDFTLQDVVNTVNPTTNDLQDCINDATESYYDPTFYTAPATSLYEFRNYGAVIDCSTLSEYLFYHEIDTIDGSGGLFNFSATLTDAQYACEYINDTGKTVWGSSAQYLRMSTLSTGQTVYNEFLDCGTYADGYYIYLTGTINAPTYTAIIELSGSVIQTITECN